MPGIMRVFAPAMAVLGKLRFVGKLSIVGALFLIPLSVALGLVAAHVAADIESCRQELGGIACQHRLFQLEESVVHYALILDSPAATESSTNARAVSTTIDRSIHELSACGAADHHRFVPANDWNAVESSWQSVLRARPGSPSHTTACERLAFAISVCSHIAANRSNLVSYPHSGVSFLSDSLAVQTRLVHHVGAYTLAPPETPASRSAAQTEIDGANVAFSMAVAGAVADSDRLSDILAVKGARLQSAAASFSFAIAHPGLPAGRNIVLATRTLSLSNAYYEAASDALSKIVTGRENGLCREAAAVGIGTVTFLSLAIYVLIALYLSIMSSVSELAGKARRLSLGEAADALALGGHDEIAIVGTQALHEIHRNLTEVKALRKDIEERRRVEAALRSSEARYRRMFEDNRSIQLLIDTTTENIVDANPAACAFYGYSLDALKGMHLDKIDADPATSIDEDKQRAFRGEGAEFVRTNRLANGELRQVEVRPTLVEIDGRQLIHSIVTDVTDRHRAINDKRIAEAKYEKIFENAIEGIFQSSPAGRYLSANPALARLYGYDSPRDLIDSITDIGRQLYVDPDRRRDLNDLLSKHNSVTEFEAEVYRKDGSTIWIAENTRVVRDGAGAILYYEGTVQDVTARRALELQREQMLRDAVDRADRDPLTGFLNHRSFHRKLREETERAKQEGGKLAIAVFDLDNFKFFNDAYGHLAGDEVLELVAHVLETACRPGDTVARFGGDEFAMLLPNLENPALESFIARITDRIAALGYHAPGYDIPIPLAISAGTSIFPDEASDRVDALELADQRMLRSKTGSSEEDEVDRLRRSMAKSVAGFSMLDALVAAVDNKDRYTRHHSEDVLTYSVEIARELGLDDRTLHDIRVAAMLHDVGKIGVPDYILHKPAKLSDDEFEAIKHHAMMGAVIVAAVPGLEHTLDAVRHHHERWDGEGYPWALKGESIPLTARIMAVADAFSAMTTDRPYRKGMPQERALAILREGAGSQWDPDCVAAFLRAHAPADAATDTDTRPATPLTEAFHAKAA